MITMNINQYKDIVQKTLEDYFKECREKSVYEKTIWEAMSYTVLLPGKKLRAVFCLETASGSRRLPRLAPLKCFMPRALYMMTFPVWIMMT